VQHCLVGSEMCIRDSTNTEQSVFSILDPRDTKQILANIINGQPLDNRQMSLIRKIHAKL
jgi:hypothetical protein